jgi:flagellar basal body-associated protein FliL
VITMLMVLFIVLLLTCVLAPFFGVNSGDTRRENAHPKGGWFPPLMPH